MPKGVRKSTVGPEKRREWFRRFEGGGESPPKIAKADGYDVRTVRKQIELERQEREAKEARSLVLRQALELHYKDLVGFAEKLERALTSHSPSLLPDKDDPMWPALRSHLRRSPLWKGIDRWESLHAQLRRLQEEGTTRLLEGLESGHSFPLDSSSHGPGIWLNPLRNEIWHRLMLLAEGKSTGPGRFSRTVRQDGLIEITYEGNCCAAVLPEQESDVKKLIASVMRKAADSPECKDMGQLKSELRRTTKKAVDELRTVRLRRVVPGRCQYCPI